MRNFQSIVLLHSPTSLGDFQRCVIMLLSLQWKATKCTLSHPWCFYVIVKMITYTYRWRFLLQVSNRYSRALVEVFSPLTKKESNRFQWRDTALPNFMKRVPSLTKFVLFKAKLSTNYIIHISFSLLLQGLNIIWVRRRQQWLFWCLCFQP